MCHKRRNSRLQASACAGFRHFDRTTPTSLLVLISSLTRHLPEIRLA